MRQQVPDIELESSEEESDYICDRCEEVAVFLMKEESTDEFMCGTCVALERPEYADFIQDLAEIIAVVEEMQEQKMTVEDMHELYGED